MLKICPRNRRRMVDNILSVWYASSEADRQAGSHWYADAHGIACRLAERNDTTPVVAAAVLSILSPSNKWNNNVLDAEKMLAAWRAGASIDSFTAKTYGQNKRKAWDLLTGKRDPENMFNNRAPKTRAFWRLIADPTGDDVVVDGHALCIALGERTRLQKVPKVGIKAYRAVAEAYRLAAVELGVAPHVVQAVTWLAWRNEHLTPFYRGE